MWCHLKFVLRSAKMDCTTLDHSGTVHVKTNQGLYWQIVMCTQNKENSMTEVT